MGAEEKFIEEEARSSATHVIRGCESFDRSGEERGIYPAGPSDGASRGEVSMSSCSGTFLRTQVRAPLRTKGCGAPDTVSCARPISRIYLGTVFPALPASWGRLRSSHPPND